MHLRLFCLLPVAACCLIAQGCSKSPATQSPMQLGPEEMPRANTSPTRPSMSAARRQREPLPSHTKNPPAMLRAHARDVPAPLRAEGGLAHEHAKTGHILDIASRRAAATTSPAHTIPPEKLTHSRNSVAVSVLCTEADSVCPLFLAELKRALSRDQVHVIPSRPKSDM